MQPLTGKEIRSAHVVKDFVETRRTKNKIRGGKTSLKLELKRVLILNTSLRGIFYRESLRGFAIIRELKSNDTGGRKTRSEKKKNRLFIHDVFTNFCPRAIYRGNE